IRAGGGRHGSLRRSRVAYLGRAGTARGARVPRRRRRLRMPLGGRVGRRRSVHRRNGGRHRARARRRRRRYRVEAGPEAAPTPAAGAPALAPDDGALRGVDGRPARGAVPRRASPGPVRVRRLGVLGAEGEGDLLLPRSRRALLLDPARTVVPAPRSGPRGGVLPVHGTSRRGDLAPPVLVPLRRLRRGRRRAALATGTAALALASAAARAGCAAGDRACSPASGG